MNQLPYRGVQFDVEDQYYVVPALTLDQAEELAEDIDVAQAPITDETRMAVMKSPEAHAAFKANMRLRQAAMKRVITVALRRNYPNITPDAINTFVDVGNVAEVFNAAMGIGDQKKVRAPVSLNGAGPLSTSAGATSIGGASRPA